MLNPNSTVTEGSPATDVCLTVAGSPSVTELDCNLDIMLTTIPGKAGIRVAIPLLAVPLNTIVHAIIRCCIPIS